MTQTFEISNHDYECIGDAVLLAVEAAYRAGKVGDKLVHVGYTGCEANKNFQIFLETSEYEKSI